MTASYDGISLTAVPGGPSTRADVGVLVVHGIGRRSEHAKLFEEVTNALEAEGASSTGVGQLGGVVAACCSIPGKDGSPLSALLVDGRWEDVVRGHDDAPRPWRVWGWTLLVLPYLLLASGALANAGSFFRHGVQAETMPWSRSALRWMLGTLQSAVVRLILAPHLLVLAAAAGTCALLLSSLPCTRSRRFTGAMTHICQVVVGDAWAFARSPARDAALQRLEGLHALLEQRANRLVVVGHSQGAALSRTLCARRPGAALITLGSGAQLLAAGRAAKTRRIAMGWAAVLLYPAYFAWLLQQGQQQIGVHLKGLFRSLGALFEHPLGDPDALASWLQGTSDMLAENLITPLDVVALTITIACLVMLMLRPPGSQPVPEELTEPERWVDVSSVYDPVCVGGSGIEPSTIAVAVSNGRGLQQLLTEHTTYLANPDVRQVLLAVMRDEPVASRLFARTDDRRLLRNAWWWALPILLPLGYAIGSRQLGFLEALLQRFSGQG